jgi:DDE superfamily endonuclease/Winged helix-turn helix
MGLSPQRPLHQAYQLDPDAVDRWKREQFPVIRAEAKKAGATAYFADEAGIRSDYHCGTTWAPVGRTPVYLIVDGHPSHRAKTAAQFIASTDDRLRLYVLPGCSPELNPDEWVWKNIKHDRIGTIRVTSKDDLKTKATNAWG